MRYDSQIERTTIWVLCTMPAAICRSASTIGIIHIYRMSCSDHAHKLTRAKSLSYLSFSHAAQTENGSTMVRIPVRPLSSSCMRCESGMALCLNTSKQRAECSGMHVTVNSGSINIPRVSRATHTMNTFAKVVGFFPSERYIAGNAPKSNNAATISHVRYSHAKGACCADRLLTKNPSWLIQGDKINPINQLLYDKKNMIGIQVKIRLCIFDCGYLLYNSIV